MGERHPRFHLHFISTSSSWLNMVERWFRDLTERRIRRGVFRSVPELIQAIEEYPRYHNVDPEAVRLDEIRSGHPGESAPGQGRLG